MMVVLVTGLSMGFGFLREVLCAAYLGTTAVMDTFLIAYMPFDLIQPATRDISAEGVRLSGDPGSPGYMAALARFAGWCVMVGAILSFLYLLVLWFGRTTFHLQITDRYWLFSLAAIACGIFLAMCHAGLCTHFVNRGNILFQVSQNLWINIGMILLLLISAGYAGGVMLALGVALGSAILVLLELVFLMADRRKSASPDGRRQDKDGGDLPRGVPVSLWPILFIMLQAIGSKGQILVERTLGAGLPAGNISALNYAFRLYAFPFTLVLSPIVLPMVPRLASAYRNGNTEQMLLIAGKALRWSVLLVIPAVVLINLLGEPFVDILLQRGRFTPEDVRIVSDLLMIYSFGSFGWILLSISVRVLWIMGRSGLTVAVTWLGIVQYYAAGYWLTGAYGAKGLAMGSAVYFNLVGLVLYCMMKAMINKTRYACSA